MILRRRSQTEGDIEPSQVNESPRVLAVHRGRLRLIRGVAGGRRSTPSHGTRLHMSLLTFNSHSDYCIGVLSETDGSGGEPPADKRARSVSQTCPAAGSVWTSARRPDDLLATGQLSSCPEGLSGSNVSLGSRKAEFWSRQCTPATL